MGAFLRRLLLFTIPFWLYAAAVFVVDPFDFFGVSHLVPDAAKLAVSEKLDPPLWKMIEFHRHPVPNVLLGDSRMGAIQPAMLERATGEEYYNFFYGGASLREISRTFWYADSTVRLKNVYIGVNFSLYNGYVRVDRTEDYRTISRNPALYFVNPTVVQSLALLLWNRVTGQELKPGLPPMSHEVFWKYQLEKTAHDSYAHFRHPDEYRDELARIAARCRARGVRLAFIIFPTHTDLQARVADFGLTGEEARFRREIAALGPVYDYDFPSRLTSDRKNFEDPYHCRENVTLDIVADVWGGGPARFARRQEQPAGLLKPTPPAADNGRTPWK